MSAFIDRQQAVIARTGLGLLPGITLCLFLCMGMIAAIILAEWWVIATVLVGIFIVTAVMLAVISALLGDEEEIYSHD